MVRKCESNPIYPFWSDVEYVVCLFVRQSLLDLSKNGELHFDLFCGLALAFHKLQNIYTIRMYFVVKPCGKQVSDDVKRRRSLLKCRLP